MIIINSYVHSLNIIVLKRLILAIKSSNVQKVKVAQISYNSQLYYFIKLH